MRTALRVLLLLVLSCITPRAFAQSLPVEGDITAVSDPCIIKAEGRYYIFCSGPGIPIRVSDDLKSWKRTGAVFPSVPAWAHEKVLGARNIWAPDISFRNGEYQLYYAVSTLGSRRSVIGLATNRTLDPSRPDYAWQDRGLVVETHETDDYNAIDPQLVAAPPPRPARERGPGGEGPFWLAFGSFWSGIKLVEVDPQNGKPKPGAPLISIASRPQAKAIEGAFLIRRGGWWYLFASHDFTGRGLESTYKIVVGRAKEVTGPYRDREGRDMMDDGGTTVVWNSADWRGPGHNAVLQGGSKTWLVYHALDVDHRARLTLRIDPVRWTRDGWPEVERSRDPRNTFTAASGVAGRWEHRVDHGAAAMVRLLPNGHINTPDGPATWSLDGDTLEMRWPNSAAPGGVFVDRCRVTADRAAYEGHNQQGRRIRGARVTAER